MKQRIQARKRVKTFFPENDDRTDQSFKEECDVNNIVSKFSKTGAITHISRIQGVYADLTEVTDLLAMKETVQMAQNAFDALPSSLRNKLNNDPSQFIEYLNDPKNSEELISLGILTPKAGAQYSEISKPPAGETQKTKTKKYAPPNDDELNDDDPPVRSQKIKS